MGHRKKFQESDVSFAFNLGLKFQFDDIIEGRPRRDLFLDHTDYKRVISLRFLV